MRILSMNITPWYTCMAYTGTPILYCDVCNVLLLHDVKDMLGSISTLL